VASAFPDEKQKELVSLKIDITRSLTETMRVHLRPCEFSLQDKPLAVSSGNRQNSCRSC